MFVRQNGPLGPGPRRSGSLAVLSGALAFALSCSAVGSGGDDPKRPLAPPSSTQPSPPPAQTAAVRLDALRAYLSGTGRPSLKVCVFAEDAASVTPTRATALVQRSLDDLAGSALAGLTIAAVEACPTTPVFLATRTVHPQNSSASASPAPLPRVTRDALSPYLLFVVVVRQEQIDRIFGRLTTRRGSEQLVCEGGDCFEGTTSVYIADAAVEDARQRSMAILEGLGFAGRT